MDASGPLRGLAAERLLARGAVAVVEAVEAVGADEIELGQHLVAHEFELDVAHLGLGDGGAVVEPVLECGAHAPVPIQHGHGELRDVARDEDARVVGLKILEDEPLQLELALHEKELRAEQRFLVEGDGDARLLDVDGRHEAQFHAALVLFDEQLVRGDGLLLHPDVLEAVDHVVIDGHDRLHGVREGLLPAHLGDFLVHAGDADFVEIRGGAEALEQRLADLDAAECAVLRDDGAGVAEEGAAQLRLRCGEGEAHAPRRAHLQAGLVAVHVLVEDHGVAAGGGGAEGGDGLVGGDLDGAGVFLDGLDLRELGEALGAVDFRGVVRLLGGLARGAGGEDGVEDTEGKGLPRVLDGDADAVEFHLEVVVERHAERVLEGEVFRFASDAEVVGPHVEEGGLDLHGLHLAWTGCGARDPGRLDGVNREDEGEGEGGEPAGKHQKR